jgi:DHA1 family tetracycline resistance protein-like MFS transporter
MKQDNNARKILLQRGMLLGSLSIFLSILGSSVTFPFLQAQRDSLGCDALCYGSMQSFRSGLSLVGNILVGRLSDKVGRSTSLWIGVFSSLLSYIINFTGNSINAIWLSMIPYSLFNQNFSVFKALFADYNNEVGSTEAERATSMGRLGMAMGISFMLGPTLGALFLTNYYQATAAAFILTAASSILLFYLPTPSTVTKITGDTIEEKPKPSSSGWFGMNGLTSLLDMPVARTSGARLLFFMRCNMALAFSIFMTVWTVSLKQRFAFGATDHAYFMGWVGLCYAISQGVLARMLIDRTGDRDGDPTRLLLICLSFLGGGRVLAMMTQSVPVVYFVMALVIVALGVVNTIMAAACARLAGPDQVLSHLVYHEFINIVNLNVLND